MYRAILFDFFDVIYGDPLHAWLNSIGEVRHGEYDAAANDLDLGKITLDEFVARVAKESGQTPEQVEAKFAESTIDTDVKALITELKPNYKVGLISNANSTEIRPLLAEHALQELFDEMVISSEVQLAKPDVAIFQLMLDRLGVKPQEAIFIDDNQRNTDAASTIGITGVWFEHGPGLRAALKELGIQV